MNKTEIQKEVAKEIVTEFAAILASFKITPVMNPEKIHTLPISPAAYQIMLDALINFDQKYKVGLLAGVKKDV